MAKVSLRAKRERFIVNITRKNAFLRTSVDKARSVRDSVNNVRRKIGYKTANKILFWQDRRDNASDLNYFEHMRPFLDAMPGSNGGRFYLPYDVDMGIICDEFLYNSYKSAARMHPVTPENYKNVLEKLDLLLVASAWKGLEGEWTGLGEEGHPLRAKLFEIIELAKGKNIPVIFYSKEDPPNYKLFLDFARRCDCVFTSCAEVMENYKRDCGHDCVDTLCFSINPLYHNPVGLYAYPKDNAVLFAGTWMTKYPERLADMRVMFDGVLGAGYRLKILDRCFSRFNTRYVFPQKYWKFVSPEISHEYLQKVHKLYNWAININTIKDSATMFANRVYELQANGNLMISNHSVGVEKMFPGIFVVDTEEDVIRALTSLTAEEIFAKQTEGVRRVMTGETCFDRVGKILRAAGIKASQPERKVLVFAQNVDFAKKICENQSYKAGRVEVAALDSLSDDRIKSYDIIAFMDESENYDSFYLEDMINGFKYTACDYITQDPAVRHGYVGVMKNRNRTVFWQEAFAADRLASFEGVTELKNGYSTGRTTSAFNALASHNS